MLCLSLVLSQHSQTVEKEDAFGPSGQVTQVRPRSGDLGCILSEQRIGNVIQMVRGASGSSPKRLQKKGT